MHDDRLNGFYFKHMVCRVWSFQGFMKHVDHRAKISVLQGEIDGGGT